MAKLNERIKERRLASGLTLLQVAEELGVKEATVQRYESGEIKNIKHETIAKLAEIFKCAPEYLMGWSDHAMRLKAYGDKLALLNLVAEHSPNYSENTIAAHKENNEAWTQEELKKIEDYKQLLLAARNKKK